MKTSIKAFTIMEMLINLVIMSVIMGLIYFAYASFAQHITTYQTDISAQNTLSQIHNQLKVDMYESEKIVRTPKGFDILSYDQSKITYFITDHFLIRKQVQEKDSLAILKVSIDEEDIGKEPLLIRKISITTALYDEEINFDLHKEYPPNLILKL